MLRQILAETVLLATAGGVFGSTLANFGVRLILAFLGNKLPRSIEVGFNVLVLGTRRSLHTHRRLRRSFSRCAPGQADVNQALKQGLGRTDSEFGAAARAAYWWWPK